MIGTVVATAFLSFYCLSPTVSPLFVVLLIGSLSFSLKLFLNTNNRNDFPLSVLLVISGLSLGSILSFLFFNPSIFSLLSFSDLSISLLIYTLTIVLLPFSSILISEILCFRFNKSQGILFPSLLFSLIGILQEKSSGVGRALWWISLRQGDSAFLRRGVTRFGGTVLMDFVFAIAGFSLSSLVWDLVFEIDEQKKIFGTLMIRSEEERDLLQPEVHEEQEQIQAQTEEEVQVTETTPLLLLFNSLSTTIQTSQDNKGKKFLKPLSILSVLLLVVILSPLFDSPLFDRPIERIHPSPIDREFTYPPIQVGCVNPPITTFEREEDELELILKETKKFASRGIKIISWGETAIAIKDQYGRHEDEGEEWGGIRMGKEERKLLRKVGEIADLYKVYILSAYSIEQVGRKHHKSLSLNVATLIEPTSLAPSSSSSATNSTVPWIVFSTTKHHPIQSIESYSHSRRRGEKSDSLPLCEIPIPHSPKTPRSVPYQRLTISAAICQDINYPSLFDSYHLSKNSKEKIDSISPQLILNPSKFPSKTLRIYTQFPQVRSRAIEESSWVLRCDSTTPGGGVSGLIKPDDGSIKVLEQDSSSSDSWSSAIDPELASTIRTRRIWGSEKIGKEFASLIWIALFVLLVELIGNLKREHLEWGERRWESVKNRRWWRWNRERLIEI